MATKGTIQGTTKNSSGADATTHYGTWIYWERNSYSIANNTSNITVKVRVQRIDGYSGTTAHNLVTKPTVTLKVGGKTKTATISYIDTRDGAVCTFATWTGDVSHNADGTLSLSLSCSWSLVGVTTLASGSISGTAGLDTIPRYATSVQSLDSKTETTIKMNWSSDNTVDYIWYSKDNGSTWTGIDVTDGKSGSYTISGLSAYTEYKVKTRVRRKESQLTTDSSALTVTTYNYPYCTTAPSFTIGNAVALEFYNPLSRTLTWQVLGADGSNIAQGTTTGTSYKGINDDGSVANLYKSIPNAKSGTYSVKITYGNSVKTTTGGTYSVKGTEIPTIGSITYADTNTTVTAITGNNQHIVQNQSNLKVTFASATAKNSATIKSHTFVLNGVTKTSTSASGSVDFGKVNSSNNLTLTVTVTDSRGLTATTTKTITMLAHTTPSAVVTLERLNNYEDETHLTVDGSVSSVNGKNTMTIQYRYKVSGGTYGDFVTIEDNKNNTLNLSKNNVYIFNVVVTDVFGAKFEGDYVLNKGVLPLFIDIKKNSVGVNCFPSNSDSLEVDGLVSANSLKCKNLLYTPYTEKNKLTITATKDDHYISIGYYCYLEQGKKYTFSCKTDGVWGGTANTDTVEAYMLKDDAYDTAFRLGTPPHTFTVSTSGAYFLRCDVNKKDVTHSFWDFQIEEGSVATDFVEAKQFEYEENYYLGEQKVGYWFNGKPLYRKIISLTASQFGTTEATAGKTIEIPHKISNIKNIVKMEEIWLTNSQYRKFPSNYFGNAGWDGHYYGTTTSLVFELGTTIYNRLIYQTTYLYVMLYYTKTTD